MNGHTSLKPLRNSSRYKVWYNQAQYDIQAAEINLENGFPEWAAYQAEQSVEKALKAVLVYSGWYPPRMHKISVLIALCNQVNLQFSKARFTFKRLESFTFISRYPFLIPGKDKTPHDLITKKDAQFAVDEAKNILQIITDVLHQPDGTGVLKTMFDYSYTEKEVKERLENVKNILLEKFDVQKIILFGSFAREKKSYLTGTMDLLIIANTDLPFIDRIVKVRKVTAGQQPIIEPLIYTPEEFRIMTEEEGEGFFESALEEGEVVYEKHENNQPANQKSLEQNLQ